jgi:hypothetical protein
VRALAIVAALACACGGCGAPHSVAIVLTLDGLSCGTTEPEAVSVGCLDGAIGVYGRIEGRDRVDAICVPFSGQPGATLMDLPAALADWSEAVDSYREGQVLTLELYVYPGPCPPLDQRGVGALLWGLSAPTTLESASVTVDLVVHCEGDVVPCP